MWTLLFSAIASAAGIAPECQAFADQKPQNYDEQQQQDFLANYYALVATSSPTHGPIPHQPGHGAIAAQLSGLPPLGCRRRFALGWTKTEDTNKSPVLPALTASFALDGPGELVPYAEVSALPPIPVAGTRNLLVQAAIGAGLPVGDHLQVGARAHLSILRTVGEIATPIAEGDPGYYDLFLGSSSGVQALVGYQAGPVTPFLALGLLDASTMFYVGDDHAIVDNLHPYLGPDLSLGVDGLVLKDRLRFGVAYYGAPGGHRTLGDADNLGFAAYGRLHTIRARIGVEL